MIKSTEVLSILVVLIALLIVLNFAQFVPKAVVPQNAGEMQGAKDLGQTINAITEQPLIPETMLNSCPNLNGDVCGSNEYCSGNLLDASESNCCSIQCTLIDSEKPTVFIFSPEPRDQVHEILVEVKVSASDNVGVSKVDFYIDGDFNASLSSRPYTFIWNTKLFPKGDHGLRAIAYDVAGNFAEHGIGVNLR